VPEYPDERRQLPPLLHRSTVYGLSRKLAVSPEACVVLLESAPDGGVIPPLERRSYLLAEPSRRDQLQITVLQRSKGPPSETERTTPRVARSPSGPHAFPARKAAVSPSDERLGWDLTSDRRGRA
jgi:hypothetical protein